MSREGRVVLDAETRALVERHVLVMQRRNPDFRVTMTDAVRSLVKLGLRSLRSIREGCGPKERA